MSGLEIPSAVGLTDISQIKPLITRTRFLFYMMDVVLKGTVPMLGIPMVLVPYFNYCTLQDTLLYGVPNSLHFILSCYYCGINFYQFIYFYLICYYLKIKIKTINTEIQALIKNKEFRKIQIFIKQLNQVYVEIDEYNKTFFASFLLTFWLTVGSVFVLLLFGAIFQNVNIVYKIVFYYNSALFAGCIALVIFTPSSLNSEAFKSYNILNSLMSANQKDKYFLRLSSLPTRFKVFFKI